MELRLDVLQGKTLVCRLDEALAEGFDVLFFDGQPRRIVVTPKVFEKVGVFTESGEEGEFGYGSHRAFSKAVVDGDDRCRSIVLFCDARCDDGDDPGMSLLRSEKEGFILENLWVFFDVFFDIC